MKRCGIGAYGTRRLSSGPMTPLRASPRSAPPDGLGRRAAHGARAAAARTRGQAPAVRLQDVRPMRAIIRPAWPARPIAPSRCATDRAAACAPTAVARSIRRCAASGSRRATGIKRIGAPRGQDVARTDRSPAVEPLVLAAGDRRRTSAAELSPRRPICLRVRPSISSKPASPDALSLPSRSRRRIPTDPSVLIARATRFRDLADAINITDGAGAQLPHVERGGRRHPGRQQAYAGRAVLLPRPQPHRACKATYSARRRWACATFFA